DQTGDRNPIGSGVSKIASERTRNPAQIADIGRLIETQLLLKRGDGVGARSGAKQNSRRIAWQKIHAGKNQQRGYQQCQYKRAQTAQENARHRGVPFKVIGLSAVATGTSAASICRLSSFRISQCTCLTITGMAPAQ